MGKLSKEDELVQQLIAKVQEKKAAITKAEKPNWETNCSFGYLQSSSNRVNLQTVGDVQELIQMLGFLIQQEMQYTLAASRIGFKADFKWLGFTLSQWENDITTRVNKIQLSEKKKELATLEARLDKLLSPELKRKLELEEIQKGLADD
jgi:hypothetical protein